MVNQQWIMGWLGLAYSWWQDIAWINDHPANERQRYFVTTSLIGWVQAWNQPCITPYTNTNRSNHNKPTQHHWGECTIFPRNLICMGNISKWNGCYNHCNKQQLFPLILIFKILNVINSYCITHTSTLMGNTKHSRLQAQEFNQCTKGEASCVAEIPWFLGNEWVQYIIGPGPVALLQNGQKA